MLNSYAGESLEKKLARAQAYRIARKFLSPDVVGNARVVGLSGPHAHDVSLVRSFGISYPERVSLADLDPRNAAAASALGAHGFCGPIEELPCTDLVDLAVFDWCGHADTETARRAYARFRYRSGSLIMVTQLRARETAKSETKVLGRLLRATVSREENWLKNWEPDWDRQASLTRVLYQACGLLPQGSVLNSKFKVRDRDLVLWPRATIRYCGHSSPMLISLFQLRRAFEARRDRTSMSYTAITISKATPSLAIDLSDELDHDGFDGAGALCVSRGTLAAWRAHRTMGTYAEAAS